MAQTNQAQKAAARIQSNRERKARRFTAHFMEKIRERGVDPLTSKPALESALAIARDASQEQWAQLAEHLTQENREHGIDKVEEVPSPATVVLIVSDLQKKIAAVEYQRKQREDDAHLFDELRNDSDNLAAMADAAEVSP